MDPNQKPSPPKADKPTPPKSDAETGDLLIKARVRPNNKYDGKVAGEIVEVTAREIKRVAHALISLEDEARGKVEAAKPQPLNEGQRMFRMFRGAAREARAVIQRTQAQREKARLELLGLTVTGGKAAG